MELKCATCGKWFMSLIALVNPKLMANKAFCSDHCWLNNNGGHE